MDGVFCEICKRLNIWEKLLSVTQWKLFIISTTSRRGPGEAGLPQLAKSRDVSLLSESPEPHLSLVEGGGGDASIQR